MLLVYPGRFGLRIRVLCALTGESAYKRPHQLDHDRQSTEYRCDICGDVLPTPGHLGGHRKAHRNEISSEEAVTELQRLHEEEGRTPTSDEMAADGAYSILTVEARFGTWNEGLRAAGLDPAYTGRVTVPVLYDTETETIVNNESADIARMLNQAFDEYATKEGSLSRGVSR